MIPTEIKLDFNRVFCIKHGEPFRAEWPKGFVIFSKEGLSWLLSHYSYLFDHPLPVPKLGISIEMIESQLDISPICCRLPNEEIIRFYKESSIGTYKLCHRCQQTKMGTPIFTQRGVYSHTCFDCWIYRFRGEKSD